MLTISLNESYMDLWAFKEHIVTLIKCSFPCHESEYSCLISFPETGHPVPSHLVTLQRQWESRTPNLAVDWVEVSKHRLLPTLVIYEQGQAWHSKYASAIRKVLDLSAKCKIPRAAEWSLHFLGKLTVITIKLQLVSKSAICEKVTHRQQKPC